VQADPKALPMDSNPARLQSQIALLFKLTRGAFGKLIAPLFGN